MDHLELKMAGQLMDVSACGFRIRHGPPALAPGHPVMLLYRDQAIKVHPVWSREISGGIETGFQREEVLLVRNLQAGDGESLLQLVSPYMRSLRNTVRSILRNQADAEEVLQESLLKVLSHAEQFHPGQSFKAWLLQIATNEALKCVRKNRKYLHSVPPGPQHEGPEDFIEQFAHPGESPAQALERKEFHQTLETALDALDEMYRQVFVLRELHHLRMPDVAARLGIKLDTAHTRLHRARRLMRKQLLRLDTLPPWRGPKGGAES
ncbi:MAG: sigma-70 family RNA polymerase sigma factor [Acidobacteriia bacterium]|nr:sigma-70 family RNA polymerase sigma factor [Terriglobia bacterium]